jgi:hypothetical protein
MQLPLLLLPMLPPPLLLMPPPLLLTPPHPVLNPLPQSQSLE